MTREFLISYCCSYAYTACGAGSVIGFSFSWQMKVLQGSSKIYNIPGLTFRRVKQFQSRGKAKNIYY